MPCFLFDYDGTWMSDCLRDLVITSNFITKLWELRDGLLLVQNKRLFLTLIETDFMAIFHAITNGKHDNSVSVYSLLEYCRTLLNILDNPPITHIQREADKITDWMVRKSESFYNKLTIFEG